MFTRCMKIFSSKIKKCDVGLTKEVPPQLLSAKKPLPSIQGLFAQDSESAQSQASKIMNFTYNGRVPTKNESDIETIYQPHPTWSGIYTVSVDGIGITFSRIP